MVWKNHSVNLLSCCEAVADSSCSLRFSSRSADTSSSSADRSDDSDVSLVSSADTFSSSLSIGDDDPVSTECLK